MLMSMLSNALTAIVALLHVWFLILEMFLWKKPLGLKTFRQTPEAAAASATLAANQGLYNGFLAAGLGYGLFASNGLIAGAADVAGAFRVFFLACVIVAGVFGALTVNRRIFWVQTFPAV